MPELVTLSTITELNVVSEQISIKTRYLDLSELPFTIEAFISEEVAVQDGVSYIEGELIMKMINSPNNINYYVDENGHLILMCDTGDQDKYSNNSGNLIYTE